MTVICQYSSERERNRQHLNLAIEQTHFMVLDLFNLINKYCLLTFVLHSIFRVLQIRELNRFGDPIAIGFVWVLKTHFVVKGNIEPRLERGAHSPLILHID